MTTSSITALRTAVANLAAENTAAHDALALLTPGTEEALDALDYAMATQKAYSAASARLFKVDRKAA